MRTTIITTLLLFVALLSIAQASSHDDMFNTIKLRRDIVSLDSMVSSDFTTLMEAIHSRRFGDFLAVMTKADQDTPKAARLISEIVSLTDALIDEFVVDTSRLNSSALFENILRNYVNVERDADGVLRGVHSGDYDLLCNSLVDLFEIVFDGKSSHPQRSLRKVRQLLQAGNNTNNTNNSYVADIIKATILIQGFFEKANTTVNASSYQALVSNANLTAALVQPLVKDIQTRNFSAILNDLAAISQQLQVLRSSIYAFNAQVAKWAARDAPLFGNNTKVAYAANSLLENWNTTERNLLNISQSYNHSNYEVTGQAIAGLYNQFYVSLLH